MWEIAVYIGLGLALGFDTFAVGLAVGTTMQMEATGREAPHRSTFRLCFHFGLFQFFMPLIGWTVGKSILPLVQDYDHWIASGLLAFIASRMLLESLESGDEDDSVGLNPTRGWKLIALSFATSFDALGVGFSMGISGIAPLLPAIVIGIVAALMTFGGVRLGRRASAVMGKRAGIAGAILLFLIAWKLLEI